MEPLLIPAFTEIENQDRFKHLKYSLVKKSSNNESISFPTEKNSEDISSEPCGSGHPYTWTRVKWIGAPDCDVKQLRIAGLKVVFEEISDDEDCEEVLPVCPCDPLELNNIEDVGSSVNVDAATMALFQAKPMERNDAFQTPLDENITEAKTKVNHNLLFNSLD